MTLAHNRRPRTALAVVARVLAAWGASADAYVDLASDENLLYLVSVWVSLWYWYPLLGLTLIFTPLLFPDGRPPSPHWRAVAWVAGLDVALNTFLAAFHERIRIAGIVMDNPVGISGLENPESSPLGSIVFGLLLLSVVAAMVSVIVRYLRSGGIQRHQIKWLLLPSVLAVTLVLFEALHVDLWESGVPFAIVVGLFPVSVGVAILRYRLYDIDII